MVRASRGVSLRYAASWRVAEFPLSEDLPLVDTESLQSAKETAAGAVDNTGQTVGRARHPRPGQAIAPVRP